MLARLKTRRAKIIIAAAVVLLLALAGVGWVALPRGADKDAPKETATVMRGELNITIEAKGQIETADSVKIKPELSWGAKIAKLPKPDGSEVKKGELICELSNPEQDDEITRVEMQLEDRKNELSQAKEQLKITENAVANDLARALLKLQLATMDRDQYGVCVLRDDGHLDEAAYLAPDAPAMGDAYQAFREAELAIKRADNSLERAQNDFRGMDKLLEKGFVTRSDFLNKEQALLEARRAVDSAWLAHALLRDYTYPQTIAAREQAVTAAANDYEKAQLKAQVDLSQAKTRLANAEIGLRRSQTYVDKLHTEKARRTIIAPVDGTLIYGEPRHWWMGEQIAVGNEVWWGMCLFTIPDMSRLIATGRILEMDSDRVKIGSLARMTFEAVQNLTIDGKVTKIDQYASSSQWSGFFGRDVKGFGLEIGLGSTDSRLKPGTSCNVELMLEKIPDAVYVPVSAVFSKEDRKVCYLVSGAKVTPVEVKTGRASEKYVEILSGVSPGDKVVLAETTPGPEAKKAAATKGEK